MPDPPETATGRTDTHTAAAPTASEATPLLRSEVNGGGGGSHRDSSAASSATYRDSGSPPDDDHDGKAKQEVTPRRAVAICISVFVLIFLQCR